MEHDTGKDTIRRSENCFAEFPLSFFLPRSSWEALDTLPIFLPSQPTVLTLGPTLRELHIRLDPHPRQRKTTFY